MAALERDGRCMAADVVPEINCGGRAEVDEFVGRGVRPGAQYELDVTRSLCSRHHRWKTDNPEEARVRGLRKESWEVPVKNSKIVPRQISTGWFLVEDAHKFIGRYVDTIQGNGGPALKLGTLTKVVEDTPGRWSLTFVRNGHERTVPAGAGSLLLVSEEK